MLAPLGVASNCAVNEPFWLANAVFCHAVELVVHAPGCITVTADVPFLPSLVAVIVAEPAATPVTSPLPLTVATPVLLLDQVTTRPDNGVPFASFGVAVSCSVRPTVTVATVTSVTVTHAVPLCPSLVAVMVAVPVAIPVTSPLPSTVATAVLLLDQVTTRPESAVPFASFGVAVSCTVWPACTVGAAGLTLTKATGATQVTVTVAVSVAPSGWLLAATLTVPHALAW